MDFDRVEEFRLGRVERLEGLLRQLKTYSYKEGEFILASGKKSSYYIDCKQTFLRPRALVKTGFELFSTIFDLKINPRPTAVAGEGMGGIPLATATAMASIVADVGYWMSPILIRGGAKDHGTKRPLEYSEEWVTRGAVTVLVEDVITTGGSSLRAVRLLRDAGFNVAAVVALLDRQEGGRENLMQNGLQVDSLFTLDDLRGAQPWEEGPKEESVSINMT